MRGCNIGDYVFVGYNCIINNADIGCYTCIASNVAIGGMNHVYQYPSISPLLNPHVIVDKRTRVGNDCWIGANAVILQGVTIGDGVVIGAGSIVTHDVPSNSIAFGNPAKVMKRRFDNETWERIIISHYWEYDIKKAKMLLKNITEEKN